MSGGQKRAAALLGRFVRGISGPLERFLAIEAASGVLLFAAAVSALVWANSPWAAAYEQLWRTPLGSGETAHSLEWLVNDPLMGVFFFVVGLELRREVQHGELSDLPRAAIPLAAALGGMLLPAALYLLLAGDPGSRSGWGVPMATDIAFALAVLALLGRRVPPALRVLLLALAVLDDLGAIVVIAVFYPGADLGFAGVHPAIAGVALGLLTPVAVADRLIPKLHPWVAYGILPLFAFANAGVALSAGSEGTGSASVFTGIVVGLVVGKPLGILAASWLTLRTGLGALPPGLGVRHLVVLGLVAGVGFTMALFVAQLAFADAALLASAKLAVLAGSGVAAGLALLAGALLLPYPKSQSSDTGSAVQPDR